MFNYGIELLIVVDDVSKARLQGSAAYKTAIDVRLSEKLCSVAAVYGTAVKDADFLSNLSSVKLCEMHGSIRRLPLPDQK